MDNASAQLGLSQANRPIRSPAFGRMTTWPAGVGECCARTPSDTNAGITKPASCFIVFIFTPGFFLCLTHESN
jgi:hypothetical protein